MEKSVTFHLNKLEFHSHKDAFCQVWLKLTIWFFRKGCLKFVNAFSLFSYFLPLVKSVALEGCLVPSLLEIGPLVFYLFLLFGIMYLFLLNKLEFPSPKDAFGKFEWNRPIGSGDEVFFRFRQFVFLLLSPFQKRVCSFHKLESPSLRDALSQVWLKLIIGLGKSRFFLKKLSVYFCYYLPLKKTGILHYPRMLCAKFIWNWQKGEGGGEFQQIQ